MQQFGFPLLTVFLFICTFALVYGLRDHRLTSDQAFIVPDGQQLTLLLYEAESLDGLIPVLHHSGLEFDEDQLRWAAGILRLNRFRPGRYVVNEQASYEQLLGKMLRGEEDPARIVIHAGQSYEQFYRRVSAQFRFTEDELRTAMTDTALIADRFGLPAHLLFGRMLPNTYEMYWTTAPEAFLERMITEFTRATNRLASQLESHSLDLDEVVTLASIVQLEARHQDEKPAIAGLYQNRIRRNMRLQADPTVSYALGKRGRLRVADYRTDHPYNTYRINGLPPGPITNPDIHSIRAVLEPDEHSYLFMVANPDGYHAFTRTYAEHRREVAKWRQWLREQDRLAREQAVNETLTN